MTDNQYKPVQFPLVCPENYHRQMKTFERLREIQNEYNARLKPPAPQAPQFQVLLVNLSEIGEA